MSVTGMRVASCLESCDIPKKDTDNREITENVSPEQDWNVALEVFLSSVR